MMMMVNCSMIISLTKPRDRAKPLCCVPTLATPYWKSHTSRRFIVYSRVAAADAVLPLVICLRAVLADDGTIILNTPGPGGSEPTVDNSVQVVKLKLQVVKLKLQDVATSCKRHLDLHRTFTNPPTSEHCPVTATTIAPFPFPCVQAGFMKPISAHSRERPRRTTHVAYGSGINQTDTGTNIPKHPCPAASTIIP